MAKRASAASADTASSFESEVLCKCQRRNQPPAGARAAGKLLSLLTP